MARPPKRPSDKQSAVVVMHLTLADKRRLERAAARAGLPVATYARVRAVQAANEEVA